MLFERDETDCFVTLTPCYSYCCKSPDKVIVVH
nr:MAG TPA: Activation induced deaminase [Caudoviricetes sp.]